MRRPRPLDRDRRARHAPGERVVLGADDERRPLERDARWREDRHRRSAGELRGALRLAEGRERAGIDLGACRPRHLRGDDVGFSRCRDRAVRRCRITRHHRHGQCRHEDEGSQSHACVLAPFLAPGQVSIDVSNARPLDLRQKCRGDGCCVRPGPGRRACQARVKRMAAPIGLEKSRLRDADRTTATTG